jgi:hypothetical protein
MFIKYIHHKHANDNNVPLPHYLLFSIIGEYKEQTPNILFTSYYQLYQLHYNIFLV